MGGKSEGNIGAIPDKPATITFDEAAIARLTVKDLRTQARLRGVKIKRKAESLRKPELLGAIRQYDAVIAHLSDDLKRKYAAVGAMDDLTLSLHAERRQQQGSEEARDAASLRKKLRVEAGIPASVAETAPSREVARVVVELSSPADLGRQTMNNVRAQARLRQIPIRSPGGGPMATKAHLIDLIKKHDACSSCSPDEPTGGLVTNAVELLRMPRRDLEIQTQLRNLPVRHAGSRARLPVAALRNAIDVYDRQFDGLDAAARERHASVDRMTFDQLWKFSYEPSILA